MKHCYQIIHVDAKAGKETPFFQVYLKKSSAKKALAEYVARHYAYGEFISDTEYRLTENSWLIIHSYRFIDE